MKIRHFFSRSISVSLQTLFIAALILSANSVLPARAAGTFIVESNADTGGTLTNALAAPAPLAESKDGSIPLCPKGS